jgi:hypothetical protein
MNSRSHGDRWSADRNGGAAIEVSVPIPVDDLARRGVAEADGLEGAAVAFPPKDCQLVQRRRSPRVAAAAEAERLALASEARSDELAIDMAESLRAANSAELALAH